MSRPPEPDYALVSSDRFGGVRVGAEVTYTLVRTNIVDASDGERADVPGSEDEIAAEYPLGHPYTQDRVLQPRVCFMIFPERRFEPRAVAEPSGFSPSTEQHAVSIRWLLPGDHRVVCTIEVPEPWADGRKRRRVVEYQQQVLSEQDDRERSRWGASLYFSLLDHDAPELRVLLAPERMALDLYRTLEVYDTLEAEHPTRLPGPAEHFERLRARQRALADELYALMLGANAHPHQRHLVGAIHAAAVDDVTLNVLLAVTRAPREDRFEVFGQPRRKDADEPVMLYRVQIVDWTDASSPAYRGSHAGIHHDKARAILMALHGWRDGNAYPKGTLRFQLSPPVAEVLRAAVLRGEIEAEEVGELRASLGIDLDGLVAGDPLSGEFGTGGGVDVAAVLDGVAFAGGVLAFVVAASAPVPGSRVVAGLVWASIVAGTASSTIRIVGRHQQGISDWRADAIDGLGIVANLLMVPGAQRAWRQGAKLVLREVAVLGEGNRVLQRTLVGQIAADVVQGVLIAEAELKALRELLADGTKSPDERLRAALGLIGRLAATGGLVALSVRGNLDDLGRLHGAGGEVMRGHAERLRTDGETIDLRDGAATRGDTRDGAHHTIADVDPPAEAPAPPPRPRLTAEAEAKLGGPDALDDAQRAKATRMLDADEPSANALLARFGPEALDIAEAFETVWRRWRTLGHPEAMLRVYCKHTGTDGVRYFARQPAGAKGDAELLGGGWATLREEHFHGTYAKAGHSVARHGPHVPEAPGEKLELRVKTGVAPDGVPSMTDRSSRFSSFADWNEAHDSAYLALRDQFGVGMFQGPIVAPNGKRYPIARGYIKLRDLEDSTKTVTRPLGEGYEGIPDGTHRQITLAHPDGSSRTGWIYPTTTRVPRVEITHIRVTLGWTGYEWIVIQLFPGKLPSAATSVSLEKQPIPGKETIL